MSAVLPVVVLIFVGCAKQQFVLDDPAVQIIEAPPNIRLEPAELAAQISQAQEGDDLAAARVAEHFRVSDNPQEELRWLLVAAQLGHVNAMYSLSDHYSQQGSPYRDCAKALYWLGQAEPTGTGQPGNGSSAAASARATGSTDGCAIVRSRLDEP